MPTILPRTLTGQIGGHSPPYAPGPLPLVFDAFFQSVRPLCFALDVLVALGNATPMSDTQISKLLGIRESERSRLFFQTQFFNHDPDRGDRLVEIGTLKRDKSVELTQGLIASDIPVQMNSRIKDYDLLLVLSPVFPERTVGYSGGNASFFPGLGGPEILDAFARLAAAASDDKTVGRKETPARKIADAASAMIPQNRRAITFVVGARGSLCGLFYDTPEASLRTADLLAELSIRSQSGPHTDRRNDPCSESC